jgi:hypothetical protein
MTTEKNMIDDRKVRDVLRMLDPELAALHRQVCWGGLTTAALEIEKLVGADSAGAFIQDGIDDAMEWLAAHPGKTLLDCAEESRRGK